MKKISVKQKLVDYMIANGNSFAYTEMIKALLKLQYGPDFEYDWKRDRGYYATNFTRGTGYMVSGCGDCGVYKDPETKRWKAKYYTKKDKATFMASRFVRDLYYEAEKNAVSFMRDRDREDYDTVDYQIFTKNRFNTREEYVKKLVNKLKNNICGY